MGQRVVLRHLLSRGHMRARELYDRLRAWSPASRARGRNAAALRARGLKELVNFTDALKHGDAACHRIFVDGLWDNANYWIRFRLLCAALSIEATHTTGLLGQYSRQAVRGALSNIGVTKIVDFYRLAKASNRRFRAQALSLVQSCRTPVDILNWKLPLGIPPEAFFDAILKRQRQATVDLTDPFIVDYVAEGLAYASVAERLFSEGTYDLLVLSHALNFECTALAFAAIRQEIPVIVLYGDYGTNRFIRISEETDYFAYPSRPSASEVAHLSESQRASLESAGAQYLSARLAGKTKDIGAVYAYQRQRDTMSRKELCTRFDWDPHAPLIGVYGSNWFDFPHCSGLDSFVDFLDWTEVTIASAVANKDVNWLFRPHPIDDWYGESRGTTLAQLVEQANSPHIKLAPENWNGADLIVNLDGIVTCHGTIGVEGAYLGTPVLSASESWYSEGRIARQSENRHDYLELLRQRWWENWDATSAKRQAALYAGWYFAMPSWQGAYVFPDDSRQDQNYEQLPAFLEAHATAIGREVAMIRNWFDSNHPYFHIYKNALAEDFIPCIPNLQKTEAQ